MADLPALMNRTTRPIRFTFRANWLTGVFTFPWWALILAVVGIYVANLISTNELFRGIFRSLVPGLEMTLQVAFIAYGSALVIGLLVGLVRANPPKPAYGVLPNLAALLRLFIYQFCNLYVQILRGLPTLVTLLIVAFVIVPQFNNAVLRPLGIDTLRGASASSAIVALAITYGAFLSETFRGGIQSIEKGQVEAARALGMNGYQIMRYIVLPQALRRILPPLGNDFIAMIKDSSLVAILGIEDITQLAKLSSSASFRYMETYMLAAVLYLSMTIIGSLLVRLLESRFSRFEKR
jgi:ABC-type amino acid transport system permease subunit